MESGGAYKVYCVIIKAKLAIIGTPANMNAIKELCFDI